MGHARRWSWLVVLIGGGLLFELVRRSIVSTGNPNLVPALILLGAAVVPGAFVVFIAGRRLVFGVSGGTVALTALIGGVIGVVTAGLLECSTLRRLGTVSMLRNLAVVDDVLFLRGILSPAAHMAWTGLAAAALWSAATEGGRGGAVARFLGTYVLVVVLHATWDAAGSTLVYVVVAAISLALLAVTSHRLAAPHRREIPAGPPALLRT